jgi:hypothetical protein
MISAGIFLADLCMVSHLEKLLEFNNYITTPLKGFDTLSYTIVTL